MKVLDGLHLKNHGIIRVIPVRMTWRWRIISPIHSSHWPYAILNASNEFTFSDWLIFIYVFFLFFFWNSTSFKYQISGPMKRFGPDLVSFSFITLNSYLSRLSYLSLSFITEFYKKKKKKKWSSYSFLFRLDENENLIHFRERNQFGWIFIMVNFNSNHGIMGQFLS